MSIKRNARFGLIKGVIILLLLISTIIIFYILETRLVVESARQISRTQEVMYRSEKLLSLFTEAETGARAYLLTGNEFYKRSFNIARDELPGAGKALHALVTENKLQIRYLDSLDQIGNERLKYSDSIIRLKPNLILIETQQIVTQGNSVDYLNAIRLITKKFQQLENNIMEQVIKTNRQAASFQYVLSLIIIVTLVLLLILLILKEKRSATKRFRQYSEDIYQGLLESAPDAMIVLNRQARIILVNKQTEKLFGYTRNQLSGQDVSILVPEKYRRVKFYHGFEDKGVDTAHPFVMSRELLALKINGSEFPVEISASWVTGEKESLLFVSVRDISERKEDQSKIDSLVKQVNQANDAIYILDEKFCVKSWNMGAYNLYGYTEAEALGKNPFYLLNVDKDTVFFDKTIAEIARNNYWKGELKRHSKSGDELYIHNSVTTIQNQHDQITGYVVVGQDITGEKKLREQVNHLAAIVEQSSEAIISRNVNREISSWNQGAERMFGFTRDEVLGKSAIQIGMIRFSTAELEDLEMHLQQEGTWRAEKQLYHKNGNMFYGAITANVLKDENGQVTYIVFIIKDISLRKELEIALQKNTEALELKLAKRTEDILKSEKRFRALLENNYDIISLLDRSFRVFYRSPSAYRITGWSNEELIGKDGTGNIHPDDIPKAQEIVQELMQHHGKPITCSFRNMHKDGHYQMLEGMVVNLLDNENVKAIVFNFRDVTDRVEADEKLLASEQRFRSLIEHSAEGITLTNFEGKVFYRSASAEKIMGKLPLDKTINRTHPDDIMLISDITESLFKEPGKPFEFQARFMHAEGHYVWLEGTFTNLLHVDSVKAIVANFRDVTNRKITEEKLKESEIHFRDTLDEMLEGVQIIGFDWKYQYVNDAMAQHGKYKKEELIGHTVMEMYPGIEETSIYNIYEECFRDRVTIHLENEFVFPDKTVSWFELSFQPVPQGIFILSVDITERKHAEQKVNQLNASLELRVSQRTEQLMKMNQELEAFSYSVSHDLRAPLRAILGFTNILEEDYSSKLDDEARRITGVIKNNTIRMATLIDDLLGFSRTSRHELIKTNVNMEILVRDIISDQEGAPSEKSIEWNITTLPVVYADQGSLRQVWINLVSNAVKYSGKEETPRIDIGSQEGVDETIFYIKDNGVGFDEKYKEKLFKVFQRLHRNEEFEGTGVGLAIVEKIISKHGGRTWASSVKGGGATFFFTLPSNG